MSAGVSLLIRVRLVSGCCFAFVHRVEDQSNHQPDYRRTDPGEADARQGQDIADGFDQTVQMQQGAEVFREARVTVKAATAADTIAAIERTEVTKRPEEQADESRSFRAFRFIFLT